MSSDGKTVAIGSEFYGDYAGVVRVFEWNIDFWRQIGPDIIGEKEYDRFAKLSLSNDGKTLAVGAYLNDGNKKW